MTHSSLWWLISLTSCKIDLTVFGTRPTNKTSGIHGGYRLVSTYDLPDCKPIGGEVFWSKVWSSQI